MVALANKLKQNREERVRLRLDTLSFPLVTQVVHRSSLELRVEQPLAFLRLGTRVVDQDGREGTIRAVDLVVEGDVPSLVVTVDYSLHASRVVPAAPEPARDPLLEVVSSRVQRRRGAGQWDEKTIPFGFLPSQPSLNLRASAVAAGNAGGAALDPFEDWFDATPSERHRCAPAGGSQKLTLVARARALAAAVWERCRS